MTTERTRNAVLGALREERRTMTVPQLAKKTGLSVTAIRTCLSKLNTEGVVKKLPSSIPYSRGYGMLRGFGPSLKKGWADGWQLKEGQRQ